MQFIPAGLCLWERLVEWNDCVKLLDGLQRAGTRVRREKQTPQIKSNKWAKQNGARARCNCSIECFIGPWWNIDINQRARNVPLKSNWNHANSQQHTWVSMLAYIVMDGNSSCFFSVSGCDNTSSRNGHRVISVAPSFILRTGLCMYVSMYQCAIPHRVLLLVRDTIGAIWRKW